MKFEMIKAENINFISDVELFNLDGTMNVFIEIPAGTNEKWEISKDGKILEPEITKKGQRVIDYLPYPFNYGFIPQTFIPNKEFKMNNKKIIGDGDPLDVIVLGSAITKGTIIKSKPIGVIEMEDNGELDNKIIVLPVNNKNMSGINSLNDLQKNYIGVLEIVKIWLKNYKGGNTIIKNISGKRNALKQIERFHQYYIEKNKFK